MSLKRFIACSLLVALAACGGNTSSTGAHKKVSVVTTISTFNSFVEAVGGSHVTVQSLVPVGGSPETYQPTPQNVATLAQANILVENGAGLEAWLDRTLRNAGSPNLRIVVGAEGLPVKNNNPHLWMDPQLAKKYVLKIRDALIVTDPLHGNEYRANAGRYIRQLNQLTKDIARDIDRVPPKQRVMIVFHNAWQYYNDRFGITTLGFIEPSPGQEPNPQSIANLVDLAKQHHVRAIFGEPEYSPKLAQQIARSAGISIVDNLYDDSVGSDPRVSNYILMLRYDTAEIVKAMQ